MRKGGAQGRRGVTLVEVLVVLSIVSVLTGVLVPTLGAAREAARSGACVATQRALMLGTANFTLANDRKLPGVNVTGREYLGDIKNGLRLVGDTTSETPTSIFDWISPTMGASMGFSANRARRTWEIFDQLACASATETAQRLYGFAPDGADFETIHEGEGFAQISYLSPVAFHLTGANYRWQDKWMRYRWVGPVVPPADYFPRLTRVGEPSRKIWVADGTRYLPVGGDLDFDISLRPEYFGSFTSSGPIYVASTAYGVRPNDTTLPGEAGGARGLVSPNNRRLSYRHAGGMNVAYFDGHVASMSGTESKSDATPWYPEGSVVTDLAARAAIEAGGTHRVGEELR